jgi:hypothetical protein
MKCRHSIAFRVEGLRSPDPNPVIVLSEIGGRTAILTSQPDRDLLEIDTRVALSNACLNTLFAGITYESGPKAVEIEIKKLRQERLRKYASLVYLLVTATHEIEHEDLSDVAKCSPYFNEPNLQKRLRAEDEEFVERCCATLILSQRNVSGLFYERDESFFIEHPSSQPVYVMSFSMSATPTVSRPLDVDDQGRPVFFQLSQSEGTDLRTVFRLVKNSFGAGQDNLRAFLFLWTALEVFINKYCEENAQAIAKLFVAKKPTWLFEFISEGASESKNTLADRFLLASFLLNVPEADLAIQDFKTIKKFRDHLLHGRPISENSLPIEKTRVIVRDLLSKNWNESRSSSTGACILDS